MKTILLLITILWLVKIFPTLKKPLFYVGLSALFSCHAGLFPLMAQSLFTAGGGNSKSSFAITAEGKIFSWGNNTFGQLGNGNFDNSAVPVDISNTGALKGKKLVLITSGETHTLALATDGTVYAWGNNEEGKLGIGNQVPSPVPVPEAGLSDITAIAAGRSHSMALSSDGTVYTWGSGNYGKLGNGGFNFSTVPVKAINLSDIIAIAAGWDHAMALKSDGTVYTWGAGFIGQLGDGTFYPSFYGRAIPMPVPNISGITAIAAGVYHSLALKSDSTVYAWGSGFNGQLGDGIFHINPLNQHQGIAVPVPVINLAGVTAIAAGSYHSLALKSDSTVHAWGMGIGGELGNGVFYPTSPFGSAVPVPVINLSGVTTIAAGALHSIAAKADGSVYTWGRGESGQLGNGVFYDSTSTIGSALPVSVAGLNLNEPPPTGNCKTAKPIMEWQKTIGGNRVEDLRSLRQTNDGGYILGGYSFSNISGDKSEDSKGGLDYWVVKLNAAGQVEWDKTIGGSDSESLNTVQQTADSGYLLGGASTSAAGGDKSEDSKGGQDYWIVKLDAAGNKEWDKTIGGNSEDELRMLKLTDDGGYILGGYSYSNASGDKSQNNWGNYDYWVVKIDASGNIEWDKTIGGNESDVLYALQQTSDGGYILGGIFLFYH